MYPIVFEGMFYDYDKNHSNTPSFYRGYLIIYIFGPIKKYFYQ